MIMVVSCTVIMTHLLFDYWAAPSSPANLCNHHTSAFILALERQFTKTTQSYVYPEAVNVSNHV